MTADSELECTALRYLTDELSEQERAAFEMRLEREQVVRECLVDVMRLTAALRTALPSTTRTTTSPARQSWSIAVYASALALLLLVATVGWLSRFERPPSSVRQLALVWSETDHLGDPEDLISDDAVYDDLEASADEAMIPSWIVAAVSNGEWELESEGSDNL